MISLRESVQPLGFILLLGISWPSLTTGLAVDICASFNTGTTDRNTSIYQTNGLCHDFCIDDYAYAITQDNACWCSNYAPANADRQSVKTCNIPCPAYPAEDCGGKDSFGYVSLGKVEPSGTRGSSPASTKEAVTTTTTAMMTETVQTTVSKEPSSSAATTTTDLASSKHEAKTTEAASTTDAPAKSKSKPTSQVRTVTAGGTIKTVTVGPTETGTSSGNGDSAHDATAPVKSKHKGLSTGGVVGIVVGVILGVLASAALGLFVWFRRKKQQNQDDNLGDVPSTRESSSGRGRPEMSTTGGSPTSPTSGLNRNSTLQIDPRMDPFNQGLYARSASQESINTLRDDHDYSRRIQAPKVLRATNPDPS